MRTGAKSYLTELLASAETTEDFEAIEQLIEEEEERSRPKKWNARTLAEVAEFFGLALQTVKQWRIETPPMPGIEGAYPLQEIVAWRFAKLNQSATSEQKRQAEIEQIKLANDKRRMENDKRRGQLIDREEIERDMAIIWSRLAARMAALPEKVARLLPDAAKQTSMRLVQQEIDVARKEFVDSLEDLV